MVETKKIDLRDVNSQFWDILKNVGNQLSVSIQNDTIVFLSFFM